jgi:hypothetical protein
MSFLLCAEFNVFPDNWVLGPSFGLSGMYFTDHPGAVPHSFVNNTGGTLALQFPDVGIDVDLPPLAHGSRMTLSVAAFAGPFDIVAMNSAGHVAAQHTVTLLNHFLTVPFYQHQDPVRLVFTGGHNEGMIASICCIV